MDIRKKAIAAAVLLACAAPLSVSMDFAAPATAYATPATETQASDAFAVDFKKGQPPIFEPSDGWTNGDPFNVFWHKDNVTFEDGAMQLTIDYDSSQDKVP